MYALTRLLAVGQLDGIRAAPFCVFEKSKHFAEHLRGVTPVDLLNDEYMGDVRLSA